MASKACGPLETEEALALTLGDLSLESGAPLVRIHSQCLTGDVFHSLRCDCRSQLELALDQIVAEGRGLLIYELQEGRGIGLLNKLRAYELQDEGLDTVQANEQLGFEADLRNYALPAAILQYFGVTEVRLLSNNPDKVAALEEAAIKVVERAPDYRAASCNDGRVSQDETGEARASVLAAHSHPWLRAMRAASIRFPAPNLLIASER